MIVDWRNRFGQNWVTSVRNQNSADNCWAFAATALLEAMLRIEHCYWTRRSEGDMARGAGKEWWDLGSIGEGLAFADFYGLADPECFPFGTGVALYIAKPHGPEPSAMPITATPDRPGRTMRLVSVPITLSTEAQQRDWIEHVGPMAAMMAVPLGFAAYQSGILTSQTDRVSTAPPHAVLVVGFNDDDRYWIIKNSYGPDWGEQGFARISYDGLDANGQVVKNGGPLGLADFTGIQGTSPDPWSRRRLRTGGFVQSSSGAKRNNFEVFLTTQGQISHWYLENSVIGQPWRKVSDMQPRDPFDKPFGSDAAGPPAVVQSSFNRNFEVVHATQAGGLRHCYFNHASGWWNDAGGFGQTIGPFGSNPPRPAGIPGFIQGNRGAPGDFEVVVIKTNKKAEHWTKHNSSPWTHTPGEWYLKETFGSSFVTGGPGLVQSRLGVTASPDLGAGELHYVGVIASGKIQHWRRAGPDAGTWTLLGEFGQGITSAPCLIEGTYGCHDENGVGNFELCAVAGGSIEHWFRPNNPPGAWTKSTSFGSGVSRVIGLMQSSIGMNLELIAEMTDGARRHFWRDPAGWHAGQVLGAP